MDKLKKELDGKVVPGLGFARDRHRLKLPLVIETKSGPPFELPSKPPSGK